jgi:hypothetical protein
VKLIFSASKSPGTIAKECVKSLHVLVLAAMVQVNAVSVPFRFSV